MVTAERGMGPITSASSGGLVFVRVSSCWTGSDVSVPAQSATVVVTAKSFDGKVAALALLPAHPDFSFRVQPSGGSPFDVVVRLG